MAKKEKSSLKMTPPATQTRAESDRPVSRDEFLNEATERKTDPEPEVRKSETRPKPIVRAAEKASVEKTSSNQASSQTTNQTTNDAPVQDIAPVFPMMEVFFPPLLWKQVERSMTQWFEFLGRFYGMDAFFPPFRNRSPQNFGTTALLRCMNPFLPVTGGRFPGEGDDREDPLAVITEALSLILDESLDVERIEQKQALGQFLSDEEAQKLDTAEKLKDLKEKIEGMSRNR